MINSGGVKLNPEKIEQKLVDLIPFPFFICGLNDENLGQKLALVIENNSNYIPKKEKLKGVLEKYEIPKVFITLKEIVRTKSGKMNRKKSIEKINADDWKTII
jgi:O-succinylbenzoic acid--CoA ligase